MALGLASKNWSIEECIAKFKTLCNGAFTHRTGAEIRVLGRLIENFNYSKYRTNTLEAALKSAFSDDLCLFGGRRSAMSSSSIKVAVTATSLAGDRTYVLANYNHPQAGSTKRSKEYS